MDFRRIAHFIRRMTFSCDKQHLDITKAPPYGIVFCIYKNDSFSNIFPLFYKKKIYPKTTIFLNIYII